MSIEVAKEIALFRVGNEKWETLNPDCSYSNGSKEKLLSDEIIASPPIASTVSRETKKGNGTAATVATVVGKKRERGETKKSTSKKKGSNGAVDNKEGKNTGGGSVDESEHGVHIWTERERRKKMRTMFANLHALLPQLPPKADKSSIVDEAVSYIKTLQQTLEKLQRQKLQKLQQPPLTTTAATADHDDKLPALPPFATTTTTFGHQQPTDGGPFLADQMNHNHNFSDNNINNSSVANSSSSNNNAVAFQTWTSTNLILNICGDDEAQINICSPPGNKSIAGAGAGSIFTAVCSVLEKHNIEVLSAHVSANSDRRLLMIQVRLNRPEINNGGGHDHVLGAEIFKEAAADMLCYLCPSPN